MFAQAKPKLERSYVFPLKGLHGMGSLSKDGGGLVLPSESSDDEQEETPAAEKDVRCISIMEAIVVIENCFL